MNPHPPRTPRGQHPLPPRDAACLGTHSAPRVSPDLCEGNESRCWKERWDCSQKGDGRSRDGAVSGVRPGGREARLLQEPPPAPNKKCFSGLDAVEPGKIQCIRPPSHTLPYTALHF